MTISSTIRKAGPFPGNGSTVALPFNFKVFTQADVLAVKAVTATGAENTLTLGADYTVSLNADQDAMPGGTLTLVTAHATGTTVTLTTQIENTQGTDLTNLGGFYPKVINDALDRATIQIQQLAEKLSRVLTFGISSGASGSLPNPTPLGLLGWNAAGTALQNFAGAASASVSTFMANVVAAVDEVAAQTALGATAVGRALFAAANAAAARVALGLGPTDTPMFAGINGGQLAGHRNKLINGNFGINQRVVSGTVVLTAGQYGHDYWKAGASGCTYTFVTVNNLTTITITAGTLTQIINGKNLFTGTHVLSWVGTAQGRVGAGAYGASGLTASVTGGANTTVEFGTGTLSLAQFEPGSNPTIFEFRLNELQLCETRCCKSYDQGVAPGTANATGALGVTAMGACNFAAIPVKFPVTMEGVPTVTIYGVADGIAGRITKDATWIAGNAVQIGQGGCLVRASNQPVAADNFLSVHFLAVGGL